MNQEEVNKFDAWVRDFESQHGAIDEESAFCAWKARAALEAKQAEADTSGIVSDCDLDKAFSGANFGPSDHRSLLHQAVLKKSLNYHCGHTITEIMRELGLIRKSGEPTSKGIDMLRVAYRDLTTNGP